MSKVVKKITGGIKDILGGISDTVHSALEGDLDFKSIVTLGAMVYGGFMVGKAMGWWGAGNVASSAGAIGKSSQLGIGSADVLTLGSSAAPTAGASNVLSQGGLTLAGSAPSSINAASTMVNVGNTATVLNTGGAAGTSFLQPVSTNIGLIDGAGLTADALMSTQAQTITAQEAARIAAKKASEKTWLQKAAASPYAAPGALLAGNVIQGGMSMAELRRIEEQRQKERDQKQSFGWTRSGVGNVNIDVDGRIKGIRERFVKQRQDRRQSN